MLVFKQKQYISFEFVLTNICESYNLLKKWQCQKNLITFLKLLQNQIIGVHPPRVFSKNKLCLQIPKYGSSKKMVLFTYLFQIFHFFTFVVKAVFHSVKIFARVDFLELKILRRKI